MVQIASIAGQTMIKHAEETFPDECCGFMFGKEEGAQRIVTEVTLVNNNSEENKKRRFKISPKDYLHAEQHAEEQGLLLLGIYHSHPNHPAIPSEHDRVVAQPYFSYIIISVHDKEFFQLRSWRLNEEEQFEEETVTQEFLIK